MRHLFSFMGCTLVVALTATGCTKKADDAATTDSTTVAATPAAPQVVLDMIAAHGGMDAWKSAPTVSFEDAFAVPDQTALQTARITVEQSRRRAILDFPGTDMQIVWDGEKAWSMGWNDPAPPRFLALLNYYFVNLPWLTLDPGVRLGEPSSATLPGDSTVYTTVMMTFEPGTGDTPDDYYRLYIDPESKRLRACAYIVTYRALLPPGVKSSPEHILVYDTFETVGGLLVPTHYTIYENGAVYATCAFTNWAFDRPFDEARMAMPAGAVVDTTTP